MPSKSSLDDNVIYWIDPYKKVNSEKNREIFHVIFDRLFKNLPFYKQLYINFGYNSFLFYKKPKVLYMDFLGVVKLSDLYVFNFWYLTLLLRSKVEKLSGCAGHWWHRVGHARRSDIWRTPTSSTSTSTTTSTARSSSPAKTSEITTSETTSDTDFSRV